MSRPRFEVADVIRLHGDEFLAAYGDAVTSEQRRILTNLAACRTSALGGHVRACDSCEHQEISYNSCRNRHCPKCLAAASAQWMEDREKDLLPVPYFHVVFTLPSVLGPLALQNKKEIYGILFEAVAETLQQIAADPKHLGARIGFLSILHTWGQNLMHHPHIHCVVPGGGLSPDRSRWISCRPKFFLPVRVLSRVFRGKFLDFLARSHKAGKLRFHGNIGHLAEPGALQAFLDGTRSVDWVVYAKPPFGGPEQVLKYLARYTHRVAISNSRILSIHDGKVTFAWKDYAQGNATSEMTLEAPEFIRRFLLHSLPRGFVRIRHYGLLSNASRSRSLALCRELLAASDQKAQPTPDPVVPTTDVADINECLCPVCKTGHMRWIADVPPLRVPIPVSPDPPPATIANTS